MSYRRKTIDKWKAHALILLTASLTFLLGSGYKHLDHKIQAWKSDQFISPLSDKQLEIKEVEVEVDKYIECETDKCQILAYLVEKFGDEAANAITIINKCENSTFEQDRTNHNRNGTIDYGVMQINSIHIPRCGDGIITSWKDNIDCGYQIFQDSGWSAWACSHVINIKPFWQ